MTRVVLILMSNIPEHLDPGSLPQDVLKGQVGSMQQYPGGEMQTGIVTSVARFRSENFLLQLDTRHRSAQYAFTLL